MTGISAAGSDPLEDCWGLPVVLVRLEPPVWNAEEKSIASPAALLRRRAMLGRDDVGWVATGFETRFDLRRLMGAFPLVLSSIGGEGVAEDGAMEGREACCWAASLDLL